MRSQKQRQKPSCRKGNLSWTSSHDTSREWIWTHDTLHPTFLSTVLTELSPCYTSIFCWILWQYSAQLEVFLHLGHWNISLCDTHLEGMLWSIKQNGGIKPLCFKVMFGLETSMSEWWIVSMESDITACFKRTVYKIHELYLYSELYGMGNWIEYLQDVNIKWSASVVLHCFLELL